ncbi:NECAP-like protein CG9132 isoform X2 [Ptychodera flava]|uniref:NECAP-like protein CG9132 isoform X2 n=1 Tax=Ptychodera flava TaxID=63121 RepID=UPI00396A54ED
METSTTYLPTSSNSTKRHTRRYSESSVSLERRRINPSKQPQVQPSGKLAHRPSQHLIRRAADWKLDQHDWKGRLRVVTKGNDCIIKLEDKTSGELFAKCPVDVYPGIAVEAVMDSSRYFVIRLMDENDR